MISSGHGMMTTQRLESSVSPPQFISSVLLSAKVEKTLAMPNVLAELFKERTLKSSPLFILSL